MKDMTLCPPLIPSLKEKKKTNTICILLNVSLKLYMLFFFFFKMNISPEHNSLVAEKENSNIAE